MLPWMADLDHAIHGTDKLKRVDGSTRYVKSWHQKIKHVDGSTRSNILDGLQILYLIIVYYIVGQTSPKLIKHKHKLV